MINSAKHVEEYKHSEFSPIDEVEDVLQQMLFQLNAMDEKLMVFVHHKEQGIINLNS